MPGSCPEAAMSSCPEASPGSCPEPSRARCRVSMQSSWGDPSCLMQHSSLLACAFHLKNWCCSCTASSLADTRLAAGVHTAAWLHVYLPPPGRFHLCMTLLAAANQALLQILWSVQQLANGCTDPCASTIWCWWLIAGSAFSKHRYIVGYLFGMYSSSHLLFRVYLSTCRCSPVCRSKMFGCVSNGQYSSWLLVWTCIRQVQVWVRRCWCRQHISLASKHSRFVIRP
jgi:hypothetical protein